MHMKNLETRLKFFDGFLRFTIADEQNNAEKEALQGGYLAVQRYSALRWVQDEFYRLFPEYKPNIPSGQNQQPEVTTK